MPLIISSPGARLTRIGEPSWLAAFRLIPVAFYAK
jgi:hypothetical protein